VYASFTATGGWLAARRTGVADSVAVAVELIRIGDDRAVVDAVEDAVAICVRPEMVDDAGVEHATAARAVVQPEDDSRSFGPAQFRSPVERAVRTFDDGGHRSAESVLRGKPVDRLEVVGGFVNPVNGAAGRRSGDTWLLRRAVQEIAVLRQRRLREEAAVVCKIMNHLQRAAALGDLENHAVLLPAPGLQNAVQKPAGRDKARLRGPADSVARIERVQHRQRRR
jgi:hypothetical protein